MIEALVVPFGFLVAGSFGYAICSLINGGEKQHLHERCVELENALDDAGRTLLCHGYKHAATNAMKALGRPVLEDAKC